MNARSTEDEFERVYREVFYQMLISVFESKGEVAEGFYALPVSRQREIEDEARNRSTVMAKEFVGILKSEGWLQCQPSQNDLERLCKRFLAEQAHEG